MTQATSSPASAALSLRDIIGSLAAAQKSGKGAPAYSRYVNRPLGRLLAAMAFRVGLTPNKVTAVSAAFTFAGIAVIALVSPAWWTGPLIAACLVIGYALDSADGQLARLQGGGSPAGEWLDHMVDATKISSLHLAVLVGLFRFGGLPLGWCLVPIGYAVVAAVMFFGLILIDLLRREHAGSGVSARPVPSDLRSLLVIPTDYGVLCMIFVLTGSPPVFIWVYLALFVANAGFLLLAVVKWFREMKAMSADPSVAP